MITASAIQSSCWMAAFLLTCGKVRPDHWRCPIEFPFTAALRIIIAEQKGPNSISLMFTSQLANTCQDDTNYKHLFTPPNEASVTDQHPSVSLTPLPLMRVGLAFPTTAHPK